MWFFVLVLFCYTSTSSHTVYNIEKKKCMNIRREENVWVDVLFYVALPVKLEWKICFHFKFFLVSLINSIPQESDCCCLLGTHQFFFQFFPFLLLFTKLSNELQKKWGKRRIFHFIFVVCSWEASFFSLMPLMPTDIIIIKSYELFFLVHFFCASAPLIHSLQSSPVCWCFVFFSSHLFYSFLSLLFSCRSGKMCTLPQRCVFF